MFFLHYLPPPRLLGWFLPRIIHNYEAASSLFSFFEQGLEHEPPEKRPKPLVFISKLPHPPSTRGHKFYGETWRTLSRISLDICVHCVIVMGLLHDLFLRFFFTARAISQCFFSSFIFKLTRGLCPLNASNSNSPKRCLLHASCVTHYSFDFMLQGKIE